MKQEQFLVHIVSEEAVTGKLSDLNTGRQAGRQDSAEWGFNLPACWVRLVNMWTWAVWRGEGSKMHFDPELRWNASKTLCSKWYMPAWGWWIILEMFELKRFHWQSWHQMLEDIMAKGAALYVQALKFKVLQFRADLDQTSSEAIAGPVDEGPLANSS